MLESKPADNDELTIVFFRSTRTKIVVLDPMQEWALMTTAYIRMINELPERKPDLWTCQVSLTAKQNVLFVKQGGQSSIKSLVQVCMQHILHKTILSASIPLICLSDTSPLGNEKTLQQMVNALNTHLTHACYQPDISLIVGSIQIDMCKKIGLTSKL